ncbi:MAG: hypothetical protein NVS9B12_10740 [Vulcanimicrobiaceae bacterium]
MKFKRALVLGGAVALGFVLKSVLQRDIKRYNRLSTMSGDKPLFGDQIDKIKGFVGAATRNGSG